MMAKDLSKPKSKARPDKEKSGTARTAKRSKGKDPGRIGDCPACGKPVEDRWKACPSCGANLDPGAIRNA